MLVAVGRLVVDPLLGDRVVVPLDGGHGVVAGGGKGDPLLGGDVLVSPTPAVLRRP